MKIKNISHILIICLFFNLFAGLAMAQSADESNSSSSVIKIDSATQIFQDVKNLAQEKAQKMTDLKRGEVTAKIKAWFSGRKQAIKNGWQEEKQEFKGGVKGILSDVWNKIKDLVKKIFNR